MGIPDWLKYTPGERKIMTKLEELTAQSQEIVALLKTIDTQVEAMFEVIKNQDVPDAAAAQLTASLQEIRDAASAIGTDDEEVPA